jgi:hypothetical protein
MILRKNITYPPFFQGGSQNDIAKSADFSPSDLLRDAVTRELTYCHVKETIGSYTLYEMQKILNFIVQVQEEAVTCEVIGEAGYTTINPIPASTQWVMNYSPDSIAYGRTGTPIAVTLTHACQLAVSIFWIIFQHSININERLLVLEDRLSSLKQLLRRLDPIVCKRSAPEAYAWLCFTAAVACADIHDRVGLIMIPMPVITACDSIDLILIKKSWRYVKWLTKAHERNWSGMSTWED